MKRLLMLLTFAVAGVLSGDDLAWRFDTSGRTADVKAVATPTANGDDWQLQAFRSGETIAIPVFDSCWSVSITADGWTYFYNAGFYLLFR